MIKQITHMHVWVKNQNEALRFYTEVLGFEIRQDVTMGDYRWLTVGLKDQPGFELGLEALAPGALLNAEEVAIFTRLQDTDKLAGTMMETDDIQTTYETLRSRGVVFPQPPTDQGYGIIQAIFKDNSGNLFSLQQHV